MYAIRLEEPSSSGKSPISAYLLTIGVGYLIAVLYLFLIDVEPHQKMGMDAM